MRVTKYRASMQRTLAEAIPCTLRLLDFGACPDLGSRILFSRATFHGVAMQAPDAYL